VTAAGRAEGIPFAIHKIERTPNTLDAHRLIRLAEQNEVQDAVVEALFRAYFTEVDVYEKSSGLMQDHGPGIVFQLEVAEFMSRYEVAPLESVVVPVRTRRYLRGRLGGPPKRP
jgi:hypothetical protein